MSVGLSRALSFAVLLTIAAAPSSLWAQLTPAAKQRYPDNALTYGALESRGGVVPRPLTSVTPRLPAKAMREKISGKVSLEAVVFTTGFPGSIRVTKPLDPEIDDVCVAALEKWRFTPGMLNGEPVPVIITVDMSFSVR